MGTVNSKSESEMVEEEDVTEGSVPSTPILTPRVKTSGEFSDPRSPSNNVIRTPIETIFMKKEKSLAPLNVIECTPRLKHLKNDPRSPTTDFNRTPIVVDQNETIENIPNETILLKKETPLAPLNVIECTPKLKHLKDDPRSPTIDFNRTPIIVTRTKISENQTPETKNKRKSYVLLETNLDYVETDIDAAYIKNTPQKPVDTDKEIDELTDEITNVNIQDGLSEVELKDLTVVIDNVKDFDRKLTNLIYEDAESSLEKIDKREEVSKSKAITPLAIRNTNVSSKKKNLPKLRVADKPKGKSKIPVSKGSKMVKRQFNVQCENTPPRSSENRKRQVGRSAWDADKTLII